MAGGQAGDRAGFADGGLSIWHRIVVILVLLFLFGRGKVNGLMTDVAQGIKAFRKAMSEDEKPADTKPKPADMID
jgi:sec-independent protein translocase protein TatA